MLNPLQAWGRISMQPLRIVGFAFVVLSAGWPGGLSAQVATARDSAGIEIVENSEPVWGPGDSWSVSEEPFLRIGSLDNLDDSLFRITWTGRLPSGEVVAVSAGDHQLIVFDDRGRKLRAFGRQGEGPGEFSSPSSAVFLPGDSILVKDQYKAMVFTVEGGFVREFRVPGTPLPMPPKGRLGDTLIYLASKDAGRTVRLDSEGNLSFSFEMGHVVGQDAWIGIAKAGTGLDTIAVLRGREQFFFDDGGIVGTIPAWGREQFTTVGKRHLITGWNDTFEISFIEVGGRTDQIIRLAREPRRSCRAEMIRRFTWFSRSRPDLERRTRAQFSRVPHHDSWPAFGQLKQDAEGNLWVSSYSSPGFDDDPFWFVFDPRGVYLGEVRERPRIRVDQIGADYVLGLERDELGVEYIVLYRITRPG
ncbi:MAG: hypothetical protein KAJ42_15925 [Gemmatimonadetes bacterium]|nr:hypothetical protein [Gemmatimonadota bacterium]